ncbi:hypothetical protein [Croceicoccus pelagius]|uniref:Uncharacterized protein n=1 Tax=Croceicoccus pelagius TaxID=1703341 RepID=A0A917DE77_9SPHN|nr:hypothetical protein [Croceicoccus pelagius]GGD30088.1 hypothetical protein GCM10010989_00190 [Croceicoccus pelagius]
MRLATMITAQGLRNALLIVFVASLLGGMMLPVYTDEIGWRLQERAALDGVDKLYSDICGPNTLAVPPWFMWPVRYYSAFWNTAFPDPFYVRLSGVFYALVWTGLLFALTKTLTSDRDRQITLQLVGFGLMTMGVMPLLLIWSRPEQPILLCLTAALLTQAVATRSADRKQLCAWLASATILALAVVAFSYHLKAIVLTPVFVACIILAAKGKRTILPRAIAVAAVCYAGAVSFRYWTERLKCPDDPVSAALFAKNNLGFTGLMDGRFLETVQSMLGNIGLTRLVLRTSPEITPTSLWLLPGQVDYAVVLSQGLVQLIVWAAILGLGGTFVVPTLWSSVRGTLINGRTVLAIMLVGAGLAWTAPLLIVNPYEAVFVLPSIMLGLLSAFVHDGGRFLEKALSFLSRICAMTGIACALSAWIIYGPSLAQSFGRSGDIASQRFSVAPFGFHTLRSEIEATAELCGIGRPKYQRRLLVDDVTYFMFMESRMPEHEIAVLGTRDNSIDDPIAYLRSRNSSGIVVGCHLLPADIRAKSVSYGRICCLNLRDENAQPAE